MTHHAITASSQLVSFAPQAPHTQPSAPRERTAAVRLLSEARRRVAFPQRTRALPRNLRTSRLEQGVLCALWRLSREGLCATLQEVALVMGLASAQPLQPVCDNLLRCGLLSQRGARLSLTLAGLVMVQSALRGSAEPQLRAVVC